MTQWMSTSSPSQRKWITVFRLNESATDGGYMQNYICNTGNTIDYESRVLIVETNSMEEQEQMR